MSLRLSKYFRTSSKFRLNMQNELDLREAAHKSVRSKISNESTFLFMNTTIFQEKFALKNHKTFFKYGAIAFSSRQAESFWTVRHIILSLFCVAYRIVNKFCHAGHFIHNSSELFRHGVSCNFCKVAGIIEFYDSARIQSIVCPVSCNFG